ncbi:MAG TPA: DUF6584 family protein [Gaiellaceae bacterium]|nr:DUF6584 family protein [Gaiellaceae bacterium]
MRALERAREEVEAGGLWKARDRLEGYLATNPHDQETLLFLGEVYTRMGDLPAAGKYLYLTESWGDGAAREAFEERYGRSAARMLNALPAKPPLEAYPPKVAARLSRLVDETREGGHLWGRKVEQLGGPPRSSLVWKGVFSSSVSSCSA